MNFRECFERIDVEAWASGLGLNRLLYRPSRAEDDLPWIERLLAILAGRVTYRLLFEEKLRTEAFVEAAELLELVPESDRKTLREELSLGLRDTHRKRTEIVQQLKGRVSSLQKRSSFQEIAPMCSEVAGDLADLEKVSRPPRDLSVPSIRTYCEAFVSKVKDKDEEVRILEEEITRFEKAILKKGFGILESIIAQVKPLMLGSSTDDRALIEKCFLGLPDLVLTGQTEILERIRNSLQTNDVRKLNDIPFLTRFSMKRTNLEEFLGRVGREGERHSALSDIPLRGITRQFYYDKLPLLEGTFGDSTAVRDVVSSQLSRSKTAKEASDWLLRGAKTIVAKWSQNDLSMHARGLNELGQHLLTMRKYTHSFDVFLDSFRLFVLAEADEDTISPDKSRAITGAILSDFIPRIVGRYQDLDTWTMTQAISEEPTIILERLVRTDELGVVFRVFDELDEYDSMKVFLRFLQDNWPVADWISIIMERVLQPRLFLREANKGITRLKALVTEGCPEVDITKVLRGLEVAGELGEKMSRTELKELEQAVVGFREAVEPLAGGRAGLGLLCEGLETIVESVSDGLALASEVRFSFRPIDSLFYLDERSKGLELITIVSLQENSLPVGSFAVEVRVEDPQKGDVQQYITIHGSRKEIGYLEPGPGKEIAFQIDIDRNILDDVSAIAVHFEYFDRVTTIEPLDKKHTFQIDLRPGRKGSKFNPYVSGPAIEKQGLYVGRERQLNKLKDTLIGQSQDNIPLVLGIRRIGKTSLLKRIAADEEILRRYIPVLFDFQDMPESDTTADFLKRLCSTLHSEIGEKWHVDFLRSSFDADPLDAFFSYLKRFSQLPASKRILLLMDECEKLMANIDKWRERLTVSEGLADPRSALIPEVLGTLRKAMLHAERFSFVICGLPSIRDSIREYESRWFGLMTPIIIEPLTEGEAKELIQPASKIPYKVSLEATELILHMTGRQPYLIQLICKSLFNSMISSGRETAARTDVEEILEREILPYEPYFSDYRRLIGDDIEILRALAMARKRLGHRRRFVAIDMVADQLRGVGHYIQKSELQSRLRQMEKAERPLVERNPSRSDSYRIVIGLIERLLEEESE